MSKSTSTLDDLLTSRIAHNCLLLLTAAILFKFGFILSNFIPPFASLVNTATMFGFYLTAFGLVYLAVMDSDTSPYHSHIAAVVLTLFGIAGYVAWWSRTQSPRLGTDALLFSQYAVDLLLNGQNPYAHTMATAFEQYPVVEEFVTYKRDGSVVHSLSYPALSFLWFVPQAALGIPNLNITTVIVLFIVLVFLTWESPPALRLAPVAVLLADPSVVLFSYGGVFDILWVLPVLVSMKYWHAGRVKLAMFVLGLAFATKQTPWFIAPFLAVWVYASHEQLGDTLETLTACGLYGLAGFLLPNLPFLVWDPAAWVRGVLTPVAGGVALVKQGSGLTLLTVGGFANLPKTFYTVTMLLVLAGLAGVYLTYFDQLKWTAWIAPAVLLWFNYRSLQNYFVFFIPIAYFALALQLREGARQTTSLTWFPDLGRFDTYMPPRPHTWRQPHTDGGTPADAHPASRRQLLTGIVGTVAAGVGTAAATLEQAPPDIEVEVVDAADPDGIYRITELTLRVTNNEAYTITPTFHFRHAETSTHVYWQADGPDQLAAGATATYTVMPRTAAAALPYNTKAILKVSDGAREPDKNVRLSPFDAPAPRDLLNPELDWWNLASVGATHHAPYRWTAPQSNHGVETTEIDETDAGNARVTVANVERDTGPWAMSGIQQRTTLPDTLTVTATPHTVVDDVEQPSTTATGIELGESNHRLWLVFADVDEQVTLFKDRGKYTYLYVFLPATPGESVTHTVDIDSLYEEVGWDRPATQSRTVDATTYQARPVHILAFATVYPGSGPQAAADVTFEQLTTTGAHESTG